TVRLPARAPVRAPMQAARLDNREACIYTVRMETASKKLYAFRLSPELKAALAALKERDGVPESEAIRRGTAEYLKARGIAVGVAKGAKRPIKKKR
ncbi:MAG: hypothetical protein ABIW19_13450, partial [Vicinamibacterales bacterium]